MTAVAIRPARPDEAEAIARAVAPQPLLARYGNTVAGLTASLDRALARGDRIVVAESDGAIAGMAWFLVEGQLGLGGYLRLIALAPGRERAGIGAALMDAVEAEVAARSRVLFLLATADNDGARRFYRRRGYREAGVLPELARPGLDEVLLWKRL